MGKPIPFFVAAGVCINGAVPGVGFARERRILLWNNPEISSSIACYYRGVDGSLHHEKGQSVAQREDDDLNTDGTP